MKYQLEYDKVLNVMPKIRLNNEEWLAGLDFLIRYSPIFDDTKISELDAQWGLPDSVVRVAYDQKTKTFQFNKNPDFKGHFQIIGYSKEISRSEGSVWSVQKEISKKEFYGLISKYGSQINSDRYLQTLAYRIHYLDSNKE